MNEEDRRLLKENNEMLKFIVAYLIKEKQEAFNENLDDMFRNVIANGMSNLFFK